MAQDKIGHIGAFCPGIGHETVDIRHGLEPAASEIAGGILAANGAAMAHMILRHHQKALGGHERSKFIIALRMLNNTVDQLKHSPGLPFRVPAAAMDHAMAAGRKVKIAEHGHHPITS